MSSPPPRLAALALSPRSAVVLAAVIVVIAGVVVLIGSRSGVSGAGGPGDPGVVTVTGAPSVGASAGAAPSRSSASSSSSSAGVASSSAGAVVVHVVGAVVRPGVVTLGPGSRVSAAMDRAGGATADADLARLNLARVVADGERLYVPKVGETDIPAALDEAPGAGGAAVPGGVASPDVDVEVVDLNTADQATLETLPGIGPSLAQRILAWRDEHGRFSAVEDLLDVSGIGDGRFADLQDRVRV